MNIQIHKRESVEEISILLLKRTGSRNNVFGEATIKGFLKFRIT